MDHVQRLLGQKLSSLTQRYAHYYPEWVRDGVDALEAGRSVRTNLAQLRVALDRDSATC